ncbi:---NA--- [Paramuricea clavata]|uniref:---NA n=1 Tax=Paramuricea clavata TaxID=317549 RepID=A0A7D9EMU9_PARCT|nr:---NA--- [Paramuricea clavata]
MKVEREMYRDWPNVETGMWQIWTSCCYCTCSNDVKCFKCGQNGHIRRHHPTEQETVQIIENNKRKAEEDVSIPEEGVPIPEDPTDQRVSDMGGSPEEKTKKTDIGKKKKWKKINTKDFIKYEKFDVIFLQETHIATVVT